MEIWIFAHNIINSNFSWLSIFEVIKKDFACIVLSPLMLCIFWNMAVEQKTACVLDFFVESTVYHAMIYEEATDGDKNEGQQHKFVTNHNEINSQVTEHLSSISDNRVSWILARNLKCLVLKPLVGSKMT